MKRVMTAAMSLMLLASCGANQKNSNIANQDSTASQPAREATKPQSAAPAQPKAMPEPTAKEICKEISDFTAREEKYKAFMVARLLDQKFLQGQNLQAFREIDEFFDSCENDMTNKYDNDFYFTEAPFLSGSETDYYFECPKGNISGKISCFQNGDKDIVAMAINERSDFGYFSKLEFYELTQGNTVCLKPIDNPLKDKEEYRKMMERVAQSTDPKLELEYHLTDSGIQIFLIDADTWEQADFGCTYDWDFDDCCFIPGGWG